MKVLVAKSKPFAKVAVDGIREVIEGAGYELVLLEKYTEKAALLKAVADVDAIIIRSDIIDAEVLMPLSSLRLWFAQVQVMTMLTWHQLPLTEYAL